MAGNLLVGAYRIHACLEEPEVESYYQSSSLALFATLPYAGVHLHGLSLESNPVLIAALSIRRHCGYAVQPAPECAV